MHQVRRMKEKGILLSISIENRLVSTETMVTVVTEVVMNIRRPSCNVSVTLVRL